MSAVVVGNVEPQLHNPTKMQATSVISASAPVMFQQQWHAPNLPSSGNMAGMVLQPHHHPFQIIPPPPPPPQHYPNRPSPIFFSALHRGTYLNICLPLYRAALKGDWKTAKSLLDKCPDAINVSITRHSETALHIASSTKHEHFVTELVNRMNPRDLALQKQNGYTALCVAAEGGIVDIAKIMLRGNNDLLNFRSDNSTSPLLIASILGHKEMLSYLYSMTNDMKGEEWSAKDRIMLLYYCVNNKIYDVALQILDHHKEEVAKAIDDKALHILARKPAEFVGTSESLIRRFTNKCKSTAVEKNQALKIVRIIWGEVVKMKDEEVRRITDGPPTIIKVEEIRCPGPGLVEKVSVEKSIGHHSRVLFVAARLGNTKFIVELLRLYPELIWKLDNDNRTIFHVAVLYRQESVYNLLYEIGSMKYMLTSFKDVDQNNILHLASMAPDQNWLHNISGAVFQMQRELQWFKEVQNMVHPSFGEAKNKYGKTPKDLFTEQHAYLVEKGQIWMKETLSQCMVVAALIATIMFAAAFTLPGGNNEDNGRPIYRGRSAFVVFVITDAISLFTSSVAIVLLLAILMARYKEEDFLKSLPMKLMFALLTLLLAIMTMMIAFSASFFLVFQSGRWVTLLVTSLAGIPVILFAVLQYHLFFDVFRPLFSSRFGQKKYVLLE